jgi:DNA invertase Pin-like site-specific DNA recombinase
MAGNGKQEKRARKRVEAVAYMRTSSSTNVGPDKDSEKRQRSAIERFAKSAGFEIVEWFYDDGVKGDDAIGSRPGFSALLDRIEGNGVRHVIVEDASRFARKLMTQETGIALLINRGVTLLTAGADDLTASDDPTRVMLRQIQGAVAQHEKARLVAKLKAARERKKAVTGKCGGRKSYAERDGGAELVATAKAIANGLHMSLRKIAAELAVHGFVGPNGNPYPPASIKSMLGRR